MRNYDPRSKLFNSDGTRRTDKNGNLIKIPAEKTMTSDDRKQYTVQNVVIIATVYESSSWGGQKFDGYVYLPNEQALQRFKDHVQKTKSPEEYNFITDVQLRSITDEGLTAMIDSIKEDAERPWLWSDTDRYMR